MHGTMARGIVRMTLLAGIILIAGPAQGAWRAARPVDRAENVRLDAKTWYRLGPGDALEIAVQGTGEMRIKVRPVRGSAGDPETFRYSVEMGDAGRRRFKRRSAPDGPFPGIGGGEPVFLDEEDSLALQVPEGARTVRLRMDASDGRAAYVRVLLGRGLSQPPAAAGRGGLLGPDLEANVEIGVVGYDSNAYLTPVSADSADGRAYWPVRLGVRYTPVQERTFRVRADWTFDGDFYRESVLRQTRHVFDVDQRWKPGGPGRGAVWTLEEQVRVQNDTFVGRGDREEYETSSGGQIVPFGDRFDSWDFRIRPRGEVPLGGRLTATGEGSFRHRDYRRDYAELADIYSLDRSEWTVELGVEWRQGPWRLAAGAGAGWTDYDEKFSRDAAGNQVPGEPASYLDRRASFDARYRRANGVEVSAGYSITGRDDRFAGYWDKTVHKVDAEIGRRWPRGRAAVWVSRSDTSYDRARVGYVSTGVLRKKDRTRVGVEGSYRLRPALDVVLSWTHDDANNNSETFAYDRSLVAAGIAASF